MLRLNGILTTVASLRYFKVSFDLYRSRTPFKLFREKNPVGLRVDSVVPSENLPEAFDQDHLAQLTCPLACCKGWSRELWSPRDSLYTKMTQLVPDQDTRLLCGKKMHPEINTVRLTISRLPRNSRECPFNMALFYRKYKKKRTWLHNSECPLNMEST